jgi:hypothetical protein
MRPIQAVDLKGHAQGVEGRNDSDAVDEELGACWEIGRVMLRSQEKHYES